jgi:amino acid adenylation domain-containing protein
MENRDIAIIGMAGRFPDATDIQILFENLKKGKDSLREISADRIKSTTIPDYDRYKVCGYLEDIDKFDHAFFNISLGEAQTMDPHLRIMLEVVHETVENAAYSPEALAGSSTSVYVADASLEYYKHADEFQPTLKTGNVKAFLGAWISRLFDFTGNTVMVDTSCSSSLVAVHLACNDILLGDCDYAIACAVNLDLFPNVDSGPGLNLDSPDGKSWPFSAKANGMSFGEAAVAVLLKSYEKACADGDIIHAIIKGSAVNNNSNRSASLTAPDAIAQGEVIKRAWQKAGISPVDIGFIEAHGSGTQLGDTIEVGGLNHAFGTEHNTTRCAISTIKSNIGHTRGAAGLAGLVKAVLSVKHRVIFPHLQFEEPSPYINFEKSAVYVNRELQNWNIADGGCRIAGISSIGLSGTNCHLILQENVPIIQEKKNKDWPQFLFTFSAKNPTALKANLKKLKDYLTYNDSLVPADVAFTLSTGRQHYPVRLALLAQNLSELNLQLKSLLVADIAQIKKRIGKCILIVADHASVSKDSIELLSSLYPVFKNAYDSCLEYEKGFAMRSNHFNDFCFQFGLYQLLQSNGLQNVQILSLGKGKIIISLIKNQITLPEAMQKLAAYQEEHIYDLPARVEKLLLRESGVDPVLFVELGGMGQVTETLLEAGLTRNNYLTHIIADETTYLSLWQKLYEHNYPIVWDRLPFLSEGKRIELPAYQFDKTRCWIREEPRAENLSSQARTQMLDHEIAIEGFVERTVSLVWKEVLDQKIFSNDDNFFLLGGDSLKATKVIRKLNDHFQSELDFEDMFDCPTVRALSVLIRSSMTVKSYLSLFWRDILKVKNVTDTDNFFVLGGHSLNASQVLNRISNVFGVELNFEDFFYNPEISALAKIIEERLATETHTPDTDKGIGKAPVQEYHDMSHAQKRLWFQSQTTEGNVAYNQPEVYKLTGSLNIPCLQRAFSSVIDRHEILRTTFHLVDGEPKQKINDAAIQNFKIEIIDLNGIQNQEHRVKEICEENASTPFDFQNGPLLRIWVVILSDNGSLLMINLHHIISDEWSMQILVKELGILYETEENELPIQLPPLSIQYKDYCWWHNERLKGERLEVQRNYWLKQFEGEIPKISLPVGFSRPLVKTYRGQRKNLFLETKIARKLSELALKEGVSMFMLVLASIKTLLFRYTHQTDIVIGCPVAGRSHVDVHDQIGFYINIICLRTRFSADDSFTSFMQNIKDVVMDGFKNDEYPFDRLVTELQAERDPGRSPLFDVGFTWHSMAALTSAIGKDLQVEEYETNHYTAKTDFWFHGFPSGDSVVVSLDYNTDIYEEWFIENLMQHLHAIFRIVTNEPGCAIGKIDFLSEAEKRQFREVNDNETAYPRNKSVQRLFEEQAYKNPYAIAIYDHGRTLTYQILNEKSNRLAYLLQNSYGVCPGKRAGLVLDRSEMMIVIILAILKSGGTYIPIDPEYPQERIGSILADCSPEVLLFDSIYTSRLPQNIPCKLFALDIQFQEFEKTSTDNPTDKTSPHDLAYIMYTSGSTGNPKGVTIEHRSIIRLVTETNYAVIKSSDHILQLSNYAFDGSVFDIFGSLLNGATLFIIHKNEILSQESFSHFVREHQINVMFITTALFNNLLDNDPSCISGFDKIYFGGEKASPSHIRKAIDHRKTDQSIVNVYGPTEGTTFSTYFIVTGVDNKKLSIPIGTPISNSQVYVLDPYFNPVPAGVEGELYIGGDGLSRGYWNNEALNAEKFVFVVIEGASHRLYSTGDIVKWTKEGSIDFVGRRDNQVKIRGKRIELDEIKNCLYQHQSVKQIFLLVKENDLSEKSIVAYIVADTSSGHPDLRTYLNQRLPAFAIPSSFIFMESLPLNRNGKVDVHALPDSAVNFDQENYKAPANALEELLVEILQNHLGHSKIGVHDNFFSLGGDSIKAIRIISKISQQLDKPIEVSDIFNFPTVATLAAHIETYQHNDLKLRASDHVRNEIEALKKDLLHNPRYSQTIPLDYEDIYPMSDIEKGMVYHSLVGSTVGVYHDQLFFQFIDPEFDLSIFKNAFSFLVEKHEMLRTSFQIEDLPQMMQVVHKHSPKNVQVFYEDLRERTHQSQKLYIQEYLLNDRKNSFVLSCPGLWRMIVFRLNNDEYGLLWIVHHAIIDGWSNASFITELGDVYFALKSNLGFRPEKLKSSYKEYIVDQLCFERNTDWKSFWVSYLSDFKKTDLPLTRALRVENDVESAELSINIGAELSQSLKKYGANADVAVKDVFLAAFCYLLKLTINSNDIIFGLVTNGRPTVEDGDKIIGCFLNTVPFRIQIDPRWAGSDVVNKAHELLTEIKQYEKVSLQRIVKLIDRERTKDNPLFDLAFGYLDFHILNEQNKGIRLSKSIVSSYTKTNTKLDFIVAKSDDTYIVNINYGSSIYAKKTVERIVKYYIDILKAFVLQPHIQLNNNMFIGLEEQQIILKEFNRNDLSIRSYHETIPEVFEDRVLKVPDQIAVISKDSSLTYSELNKKANRLAHYLRKRHNVKRNEIVAIIGKRSADMVVAILAILKAGGAYLPVDPEYPDLKKRYILSNSGVRLVLHRGLGVSIADVFDGFSIDLDHLNDGYEEEHNTISINEPGDLAYVIYTSGSTGYPKGVMIEHRSNINMITDQIERFEVKEQDRILQFASLSFDASVYEIFIALYAGIPLVIVDDELVQDTEKFVAYLIETHVSIVVLPPSYLNKINLDLLTFLRVVITAGEPAIARDALYLSQHLDYYNAYGPTECAVCVTTYKVQRGESSSIISIGKPIHNLSIHILDKQGHLLPIGVEGEICVIGIGLARGYLNQTDLTADKFVQNPFGEGRMYRTGDLGYYMDDGNIVFNGRQDNQVKINGHRVETGEIEAAILKNEAISNCFIFPVTHETGNKKLVAYLVGKSSLSISSLRMELAAYLPSYMIPSHFVTVEHLPLTIHGKIDVQNLPDWRSSFKKGIPLNESPATDIERNITGIWETVLGRQDISINDNYFEIGGDSLRLIEVFNILKKEYPIKIEIADLFKAHSIKLLSQLIEKKIGVSVYNEDTLTL